MSTPQLELVLERVAAAGVDMRETGSDRWRGDCVACGGADRMTVGLDLNGGVYVKCYAAGCEPQHILGVLNLTWRDLRAQEEQQASDPLDVLRPARSCAANAITSPAS